MHSNTAVPVPASRPACIPLSTSSTCCPCPPPPRRAPTAPTQPITSIEVKPAGSFEVSVNDAGFCRSSKKVVPVVCAARREGMDKGSRGAGARRDGEKEGWWLGVCVGGGACEDVRSNWHGGGAGGGGGAGRVLDCRRCATDS